MKKLCAEFIGTFGLVFAGTGAIVIDQASGGAITHIGIALTFGLIVLAMIYTVGDVSGAHINPAVTLGFFVARRFPGNQVLPYIGAQCLGAIAASVALRFLFPQDATLGATFPAASTTQSFVLETILTAILMLTILSVSTGAQEKGITAGIAIGSVIALEAMFAGPICGASMNPARSLAPALVSMHLESLWIYLLAPILGALTGVVACRCIREPGCCSRPVDGMNADNGRSREFSRGVVRLLLGVIQIAGATVSLFFFAEFRGQQVHRNLGGHNRFVHGAQSHFVFALFD